MTRDPFLSDREGVDDSRPRPCSCEQDCDCDGPNPRALHAPPDALDRDKARTEKDEAQRWSRYETDMAASTNELLRRIAGRRAS